MPDQSQPQPESILVPRWALTNLLAAWSQVTSDLGRDVVPTDGDDAYDELLQALR